MISFYPLVVLQVVFLLLLLFTGFELILRKQGVKPLKVKKTKSIIKPEGKFYKADSILGFVNQSGEYHLNINDGDFEFIANHDLDGHRVTSLNSEELQIIQVRSEIWIFGCSFIYGWLVKDNETFPWLLQDQLPEWRITNFAVSGYSTLQSYLQFKETLKDRRSPEIVMVFYGSSLHDQRNVFSRNRKKAFTQLDRISPFKVPCGRIDKKGNLSIVYERIKYFGLPLRAYSSLMNYIDDKLNKRLDSRLNEFEVSKKILTDFHELCIKHNATLIVGGILQDKKTKKMLEYLSAKGIETIDISVDRRPEHVHGYDFHPTPLVHKKYADQLIRYLQMKDLV